MTRKSFTARVEWRQGYEPSKAHIDEWMRTLAGFHPALGVVRAGRGRGYSALWSAVVTVEATSLRQAVTLALRVVENGLGVRAVGVELLSTAEFHRRAADRS